jgi:hypothetical protein
MEDSRIQHIDTEMPWDNKGHVRAMRAKMKFAASERSNSLGN